MGDKKWRTKKMGGKEWRTEKGESQKEEENNKSLARSPKFWEEHNINVINYEDIVIDKTVCFNPFFCYYYYHPYYLSSLIIHYCYSSLLLFIIIDY